MKLKSSLLECSMFQNQHFLREIKSNKMAAKTKLTKTNKNSRNMIQALGLKMDPLNTTY
jgi:hypothetical protein